MSLLVGWSRVKTVSIRGNLMMVEAASIIGRKIGKPGLRSVTFSCEDAVNEKAGAEISEDVSKLYVEMTKGLNEGLFGFMKVGRTPENTTRTSIVEFAEHFAKVYELTVSRKVA